jgi:hypothetical protein
MHWPSFNPVLPYYPQSYTFFQKEKQDFLSFPTNPVDIFDKVDRMAARCPESDCVILFSDTFETVFASLHTWI